MAIVRELSQWCGEAVTEADLNPMTGASSFEELITKSREREASRKVSSSQPQKEQQQQQPDRERTPPHADIKQGHSRAGGPDSEAAQNRPESEHDTDQPKRAPPLGDATVRDPSTQYCNGHTSLQGDAADGPPGTAQCTVYARELSDKPASACCGGVPIQSGFFEPLAWHNAVPDSGSE